MRKRDWAALGASAVLVAGALTFREIHGQMFAPTAETPSPSWTPAPPDQGAVRTPDGHLVRLPDGRVMKTAHEGRLEGEHEARADLAAGMLGWRTVGGWGYPSRPVQWSVVTETDVLERDYGVVIKATTAGSGCIAPPDEPYLDARRDAYNAIMKPRIEEKFGKNVFAVARERAKKETADNKAEYQVEHAAQ